MRRLRGIVVGLTLALTLAGCGSQDPEDVGGKVETLGTTAAESTEAETMAEGNELSLGFIEGGKYINKYAGFACDLDETWLIYGADQLQVLSNAVQEAVSATDLGEALAGYTQFTDIMAENGTLLCNMNVAYQKIEPSQRLAYLLMSEDDYLDAALSEKDAMINAYGQMGIMVSGMEKVNVEFLGEERVALRTVATVNEVPAYMLQLFDFKLGDYSITMTFTYYLEDKCEELLDLFYAVE